MLNIISKIHVYSDKYYYKNVEYSEETLDILIKNLRKKRKILLYSETIFIKKYNYPDIKIEKYMDDKINEDFKNKDNFLFHYEINKEDKSIYLYSLRNNKIKYLYRNAMELSIEPIQFKIKDRIVKKYSKNKKNFIIYKIEKVYSLLVIENTLIIDSISSEDFNEIKAYIHKNKNAQSVLVADKYIVEDKDIKIDHIVDLGVGIWRCMLKIRTLFH